MKKPEQKTGDIPDDAILEHLEYFDVGHTRKLSIAYQGWEFPFGTRIRFQPGQTAAQRKDLIKQAIALAHRVVAADIKSTLPEIKAIAGENPAVETLEESIA